MYSCPILLSLQFCSLSHTRNKLVPAVAHHAEHDEHVVGGAETTGGDVALDRSVGSFGWESDILCIAQTRSPRRGAYPEAWRAVAEGVRGLQEEDVVAVGAVCGRGRTSHVMLLPRR